MVVHPTAFNAWGNPTFQDWASTMQGVANNSRGGSWQQLPQQKKKRRNKRKSCLCGEVECKGGMIRRLCKNAGRKWVRVDNEKQKHCTTQNEQSHGYSSNLLPLFSSFFFPLFFLLFLLMSCIRFHC